jgi:serine protease Do
MRIIRTLFLSLATVCFVQRVAFPQTERAARTALVQPATATSLDQLSASLQTVAKQVEPAVVQIFNSSYTVDRAGEAIAVQRRGSGSGILISADGYIVTNFHVVDGARRIQVRLNKTASSAGSRILNAQLIGKDRRTDLAVIKIDLAGLPFLTFADSDSLTPGQIVLAFGSPLGLDNSVSMGVVSAVDRQLSVDDPSVYIQTDAAINPGNSGGPLVNTSGQVVGMNALILSKSGGSEGVGLAIPSNLVSAICRQIRVEHHVHHHQVGIAVRVITPAMAQALNLPVEDGVLVEDVGPQSTAEMAGLKVGDVITRLHGRSIQNVRQLALSMYSYAVDDLAQVEVLRGKEALSFFVPVVEAADDLQRFEDLVTEKDNAIARLGILGLTIDEQIAAQLPPLRGKGGVLVAAKMAAGAASHFGDELAVGDVIYAVNGRGVSNVASLRSELASVADDFPVALHVERMGRLQFVLMES